MHYVVPILPAFLHRFPEISVEILASERHVDLIGEGVDLALRHGTLPDSGLTARRVARASFVTVAAPTYLALRGHPATPADLAGHACISYAPLREARSWTFQKGTATIVHHPVGRIRTGDAEQIRAAVLAGLGLAHAPGWLFAPEIASGEVLCVLERYQPEPMPVSLVHTAGRRPAAKVRALMTFIAEALPRNKYLR